MRIITAALFLTLAFPCFPQSKSNGKVVNGIERLLYISNKTGVSIYDINDSHKLLRKFDVPDTADYKGISASVSLGKLYLTSNLKDELLCIDLATDKIDWRRHYEGGYADSQAINPDGKTLYVPMRDSDSWWAIDAANGEVKAKIKTEHGQNYTDHPIGGIGPQQPPPAQRRAGAHRGSADPHRHHRLWLPALACGGQGSGLHR